MSDVEVGTAFFAWTYARACVLLCAIIQGMPATDGAVVGLGMEESLLVIKGIINEQVESGIPAENIILAGYSQVLTPF